MNHTFHALGRQRLTTERYLFFVTWEHHGCDQGFKVLQRTWVWATLNRASHRWKQSWCRKIPQKFPLQWRRNEHDSVWNYRRIECSLNRLFRRRSKKTWKLRVICLCVGNSPVTGEVPAQRASNAVNVSIWWRHYGNHEIVSNTFCMNVKPYKLFRNILKNTPWIYTNALTHCSLEDVAVLWNDNFQTSVKHSYFELFQWNCLQWMP